MSTFYPSSTQPSSYSPNKSQGRRVKRTLWGACDSLPAHTGTCDDDDDDLFGFSAESSQASSLDSSLDSSQSSSLSAAADNDSFLEEDEKRYDERVSAGHTRAFDVPASSSQAPSQEPAFNVDAISFHQVITDVSSTITPRERSNKRDWDQFTQSQGEVTAHAPMQVDDEDDGAFLARLMARNMEMRNVNTTLHQPEPVPSSDPPVSGPSLQPDETSSRDLGGEGGREVDWQIFSEDAWGEPGPSMGVDEESSQDASDGRSKAIAFLEALMGDFLSQLHLAVYRLDPRVRAREANERRRQQQSESQSNGTRGWAKDMDASPSVQLALMNRKTGNLQAITFPDEPGTTPQHPALVRMSRVLFIASVLYESVLTDGIVTKRDIYYRNVSLFGNQAVVDKIIDDIVGTAGLKRHDFRVCATLKGLMAAKDLKITLTNGEELQLSSASATLIPHAERISTLEAPDGLDWVLVVEKDAVMQSLCSARLLDEERLGPGVLLTGKGYPDLSTLQFLRLLADTFPKACIAALVDADPHGIDILSVYTHGSKSNAFSAEHEGLGLGSRLQWMGVKATEWSSVGRYEDLLPLGQRDAQLALKMCSDRPNLTPEWRRELAHMLHLNRKAEIQILCGPAPSDDDLEQSLNGNTLSKPSRNRLVEYIVARLQASV